MNKIEFNRDTTMNVVKTFTFFCIAYFIMEFKRDNKSTFKFRIIAISVFFVLMVLLGIINGGFDKYCYSCGLIIATECLFLENIVYSYLLHKNCEKTEKNKEFLKQNVN